jgi:hypothetical protein
MVKFSIFNPSLSALAGVAFTKEKAIGAAIGAVSGLVFGMKLCVS